APVPAATYTLADNEILLNEGQSWPTSLRDRAAVAIEFVAGWESAEEVPEPIRQGILQHVAASYSNKVCAEIPEGAKALYDPFRAAGAFGA
ncbi:head-tail connector protein, partial [Staphylococcus aureus]